jgi:hypothetical protein
LEETVVQAEVVAVVVALVKPTTTLTLEVAMVEQVLLEYITNLLIINALSMF